MIEQKKLAYLNDLYINLKELDVAALKFFNFEEISDEDYFNYAINDDIFSNGVSILTNYLSGNIESAGVDNSCRAIIEALVIIHMNSAGDITPLQKRIYRYSYSLVDLDNFKKLLTEEELDSPIMKKIREDKQKAIDAIKEHFGCTESALKKQRIDDPCFYLKNKLDDDIRFSKLLEKYPISDANTLDMYSYFSLFIHPRCEMDPDVEKAIMSVRTLYVDWVLNLVFNYLKTMKFYVKTNNVNAFDNDFFYNQDLRNNVLNVKSIEMLFQNFVSKLCILKDGQDLFTWSFLERCRYLAIDNMISLSLGYQEHIISNFKSFLEQYSIFYIIESSEDLTEFNYLKKGFWYSSRIQFDEHFKRLGAEGAIKPDDFTEIFEKYYKNKYSLSDVSELIEGMSKNSLFFIEQGKKSYTKCVKKMIGDLMTNEFDKKEIMALYKLSQDMNHASGYNFNSSIGISDVNCHKVSFYFWKVLYLFLINAQLTLEEHGEKKEFVQEIKCIKEMIGFEQDVIITKYKKHKKDIDEYLKEYMN